MLWLYNSSPKAILVQACLHFTIACSLAQNYILVLFIYRSSAPKETPTPKEMVKKVMPLNQDSPHQHR